MRPIRCVSGESSETGSPVMLMNDLSRQCPTHAQFFFTQERRTAFVGGKGGSQGLSFYVSHLVCGCVCGWMDGWMHVLLRLCYFINPWSDMNGMGEALHE